MCPFLSKEKKLFDLCVCVWGKEGGGGGGGGGGVELCMFK